MTPERWKIVDSVVQDALALMPSERASYLDRACGSATALRREVETLVVVQGAFDELRAKMKR